MKWLHQSWLHLSCRSTKESENDCDEKKEEAREGHEDYESNQGEENETVTEMKLAAVALLILLSGVFAAMLTLYVVPRVLHCPVTLFSTSSHLPADSRLWQVSQRR